jgi:hypothetical protein
VPKSNVKNVVTVILIAAKEVTTKDTKAETGKVDALKEMTVDKITATAEIGIVQNVRIIISHSAKNVIAVEKPVAAVEDVVLDKTTVEVETKDTKAETGKVDALKEMTVDKITATAETGTVQNVAIIISHSERSVTNVDFLEVEEMTGVVAMTDTEETTDVVEMTVAEKLKSIPITIGIALNVTTQISHSDRNVIAAKHLALAAAAVEAVANVETMGDDLLVEITVEDHHNEMTEEHLAEMMAEDLLVAMTVDDLRNEMTEEHLDVMTVEDLHNEMMVQDLLDMKALDHLAEMVETEEVTVADIKAVAHTDKIDLLNESQESLETLENHVAMDLGMHITAHQSRSLTLTEMIDGGAIQWVLNITTLTP